MKSTKDIWLMIHLKQNGIFPASVKATGRGVGICYYDLDDEQWTEHKLSFFGSNVNETKQDMSSIKGLFF